MWAYSCVSYTGKITFKVCVLKTKPMHSLFSDYFVSQPLHVLGISVAHHQVYCIYTAIGTCCAFQLTVCWPGWDGTGGILYIYTAIGTCCAFQLTVCWPGWDGTGGTLYIYSNWYVLCFLVDCLLAGLGWNWRCAVYTQQLVRVVLFS